MLSNNILKFYGLLISLLLCNYLFAQDVATTSFYKHYTGNLDSTMKITVDLLSQKGKVTGYYYYNFPEPGTDTIYHYGKTIPIEGSISNNSIVINDFKQNISKFKGSFDSLDKISGTWYKKPNAKSIPFELAEDYSNGSLALSCYTLSDQHFLLQGNGSKKNSPKAEINITLLYPDISIGDTFRDTIDLIITEILLREPMLVTSPNKILEDIRFDFINSYIRATEGIEDLSSTASFNWEKNITMDVRYNENNILSLKIEKYAYTGGAHGIFITEYITFNLRQKKRLYLEDIFKENFNDELNSILDKKLREMNGIKAEENLTESGFFVDKIESTDNFYINNDGIGFFYNVYSIAPYSTGATELFIQFDELTELLKNNNPFSWVVKN